MDALNQYLIARFMLNNCHVCWWAGILCKREGEEDPGDVCPPLSPKATKSLGDGDFPFLPACAAAPSSVGSKGIPPNPPPRAPPACEPARGEIRGVLWNVHVTLSLLWACKGLPFYFFFPFFFLIISQMSLPSAGTISRLYVFIIFFTLHYSLLPIPLLLWLFP